MFEDYGVMGKICTAFLLSKTLNLRKKGKNQWQYANPLLTHACMCVRGVEKSLHCTVAGVV